MRSVTSTSSGPTHVQDACLPLEPLTPAPLEAQTQAFRMKCTTCLPFNHPLPTHTLIIPTPSGSHEALLQAFGDACPPLNHPPHPLHPSKRTRAFGMRSLPTCHCAARSQSRPRCCYPPISPCLFSPQTPAVELCGAQRAWEWSRGGVMTDLILNTHIWDSKGSVGRGHQAGEDPKI
jgi:hypothetical protein